MSNKTRLPLLASSMLAIFFLWGCGTEPHQAAQTKPDPTKPEHTKVAPPIPHEEQPRALAAHYCTCYEDVYEKFAGRINTLMQKSPANMTEGDVVQTFKAASKLNEELAQSIKVCHAEIPKHAYFKTVTQDSLLAEAFGDELEKCVKTLDAEISPLMQSWGKFMDALGKLQNLQLRHYRKQAGE